MIYIFKTSVNTESEAQELKPYIDALFPNSKWNFDLEDYDKIFKMESKESVLNWIVSLFDIFDFQCEELE